MFRNIKKIQELIKNSRSLAEVDKSRLMKTLHSMGEEELLILEQTLLSEQNQAAQIDENFQQNTRQLNDEYHATVQDFKHHKAPKLSADAEKKDHSSEEEDADQMIHSLFKP